MLGLIKKTILVWACVTYRGLSTSSVMAWRSHGKDNDDMITNLKGEE